jgi:hypothetical protein
VEEFLELHPEHRDTPPHELMIARINHEHAEREKLEQARQELLKRKQALIAENKKRKEDLASLDMDLERFIDVRNLLASLFFFLFFFFAALTTGPIRPQSRSRNCSSETISPAIENLQQKSSVEARVLSGITITAYEKRASDCATQQPLGARMTSRVPHPLRDEKAVNERRDGTRFQRLPGITARGEMT